ncbi:DUF2931 family protein [Flavobacterium sp. LS1R49]|uniref:DUF2931 family protein n=1 Tax=Flavobacterium shii TaxID=2987687 RepID=A0A9X3C7U1_9FLAO|nr:DUF2931 family protein [Flavobacterium shii]MCV9929308.1 DUF2931 family protein [Flavobacterium shii]
MENNESFSWGSTITAPHMYPIEIHKGYLADDKKMITAYMNTGISTGDWGYGNNAYAGGNSIPTNLSLTWISFADKKFWKIEATLPKEKIFKFFQEGYMNKDRKGVWSHVTYKDITVGLAPGGLVVVWLTGLNRSVEIAHFQAKETFVSVDEFYRNPHEYTQDEFYNFRFKSYLPRESQAYIKEKGVPVDLWKDYRTKYNYRFNIHFYKADKESSDRRLKYVNGEEEIIEVKDINSYQNKALPSYGRFFFSQHNAEVQFDDEEILNAFKKLTAVHPDKSIDIEAKVAFMYKTTTFTVKCEGEEIPLEKTVVKMWKN